MRVRQMAEGERLRAGSLLVLVRCSGDYRAATRDKSDDRIHALH